MKIHAGLITSNLRSFRTNWTIIKLTSSSTLGNLQSHHATDRHALDLAGSREQRGSAFELYRKPQLGVTAHHHNIR